eukprot:229099-Chlamydomonas_euryale.AAC.5
MSQSSPSLCQHASQGPSDHPDAQARHRYLILDTHCCHGHARTDIDTVRSPFVPLPRSGGRSACVA